MYAPGRLRKAYSFRVRSPFSESEIACDRVSAWLSLTYKMGLMPIAEIVAEIDAYLLCLRRARQLLASSDEVARRRNAVRKQVPTEIAKTVLATSTAGRIQKVQARRRTASRKTIPESKGADMAVVPDSVVTSETTLSHADTTAQQSPVGESLPVPAGRNRTPNVSQPRSDRQKQAASPETAKAANALGGSAVSRVVVVSAEEAQQARERAAHPAVMHHRASATGLTGRAAFEALFSDGIDSSVAASV